MKKTNRRLNHSWLLTLLDLMLLMLTFFIMLYAMSSPKQKNDDLKGKPISVPVASLQRGVHLNYLEQILSQQTTDLTDYQIKREKNSLLIQIPANIFAQTQNRHLSIKEEIKLKQLGEFLSNVSNEMLLQVSADKLNTQEALLQAAVVANKLKEGGYIKNLPVIFQKNSSNDFIQIIIFEQIGDE